MHQENDKKQERFRYALAILLSTGVLLFWYLFIEPPPAPPQPQPEEKAVSAKTAGASNQTTPAALPLKPATSLSRPLSKKFTPAARSSFTVPEIPAQERFFTLANERLKLTLSTKDAAVVGAEVEYDKKGSRSEDLEKFHEESYPTGKIVFEELVPAAPSLYYLAELPNPQTVVFTTYVQVRDLKLQLIKTYSLKEEYALDLKVSLTALGGNTQSGVPLPSYYVVNGSSLGDFERRSVFDLKNISYEADAELENVLQEGFLNFFSSAPEVELRVRKKTSWISQDNRFFARVLKPLTPVEEARFYKLARESKEGEANNPYLISSYLVYPAAEQVAAFKFYYLPKRRALLNAFHETSGEYFFNLFQQFKFMRLLSSLMYWLLELINNTINNYGWSIFILTLLVKGLTFPFTYKGLKSMQRMQELAPKLEALKKNYKKKPQRLNQEMMQLYKREGVSPLGGCLPMLLPIPFFIALYSLFQNMVELKGVSFYWITDLSLPDVIYRLDFSLPFIGSEVHLLPFLMVSTAFLQSFINPTVTTPENRTQVLLMKYFMPFFFFFICWSMPSALVLFWTIQNGFSVGQTYLLKISRQKQQISLSRR